MSIEYAYKHLYEKSFPFYILWNQYDECCRNLKFDVVDTYQRTTRKQLPPLHTQSTANPDFHKTSPQSIINSSSFSQRTHNTSSHLLSPLGRTVPTRSRLSISNLKKGNAARPPIMVVDVQQRSTATRHLENYPRSLVDEGVPTTTTTRTTTKTTTVLLLLPKQSEQE